MEQSWRHGGCNNFHRLVSHCESKHRRSKRRRVERDITIKFGRGERGVSESSSYVYFIIVKSQIVNAYFLCEPSRQPSDPIF